MGEKIAADKKIKALDFEWFGASSAGDDDYEITIGGVGVANENYRPILFKADVANTGTCTLNINGIGAVAIKKGTANLETGDIEAGQLVLVAFDGTYFQLIQGGVTQLAQNINGAKTFIDLITFSTIPVLPASDPTTANQAVRKDFLDRSVYQPLKSIASTTLRFSSDDEVLGGWSPINKVKNVIYGGSSGVIRIKFDMKGDTGATNAHGRIYRNGVAYGTDQTNNTNNYATYSQDLSYATGDTIEIWVSNSEPGDGIWIKNLRVYYDVQGGDGSWLA